MERHGALRRPLFECFHRALDDKGRTCIGFEMTVEGRKALYDLTSQNVGRRLAIVLDERVLSAPEIRGAIGKKGIIEGGRDGWSESQLQVLLNSLSGDPLPAKVTFLREVVVSHE